MENSAVHVLQLAALVAELLPWYAAARNLAADKAQQLRACLAELEKPLNAIGITKEVVSNVLLDANSTLGKTLADARRMASNTSAIESSITLRPILEVLGQGLLTPKHRFAAVTLNVREDIFPQEQVPAPDHAALWKAFVADWAMLPTSSAQGLLETACQLILRHGAFLPATSLQNGIVAMPDHAKVVAAMARCLHEAQTDSTQPFLLVGGDLSGIQAFLYDIISKNASKLLKGRSFYLQLLIDSVLDELLTALNLSSLHVVYASGGGFFLLVPHTDHNLETIQKVEASLAERIFAVHQIQLTFSLSYLAFGEKDLRDGGIAKIWDQLIQAGNAKKKQKFSRQMLASKDFFAPCEIGGDQGRDPITNEEFGLHEKPVRFGSGDKALDLKQSTHDQIFLGQRLRNAKWWLRSDRKLDLPYELRPVKPCGVGRWNYFLSNEELQQALPQIAGCTLHCMNSTAFLTTDTRQADALGFVFYGGNSFPADEEGVPLTFEDLVGGGEEREGELKRLAILRMDVDNLGHLFAHGLQALSPTLAHYACLSRSLDIFFKGWLNTLRESSDAFLAGTYIVYAGGDDLFLVGRWDLLFDMAAQIQQGFHKWTCGNPELGLSGGITMVGPKFPIARAAVLADEQERKAKEHELPNGREKNAITLFGVPLNWEVEFPVVRDLMLEIKYRIADENQIQNSLINKVKMHHAQYVQQKKDNVAESWHWNLAWDFARMIEREGRGDSDAKTFLRRLFTDISSNSHNGGAFGSKHHYLSIVNVAARWAELAQRQEA